MIKPGKKTKEWNKTRAELKIEFADMGIVRCEIKLKGCLGDNFLSFAHTEKRRKVTDLKKVVLACNHCHGLVEYHAQSVTGMPMNQYLEGIIANRQI